MTQFQFDILAIFAIAGVMIVTEIYIRTRS